MKLIQSLLGRRQFLIGSMASASALALKNLIAGKGTAMAFESPADATGAGNAQSLTNRYPHFLSPLRVRNRVLKNRILHTPSPPHLLQGPENFPTDAYRSHFSDMARNAAIVTLVWSWGEYPKTWDPNATGGTVHHSDHMFEDIPPVHNYIQRMIEDVHCEGSLACGPLLRGKTIEEAVTTAKQAEDEGFDAVQVGERSWSNIEAVRADLDMIEAIRKATNLLIVAAILPYSPGLSRGMPIEISKEPFSGPLATGPEMAEVVAMAKTVEGLVDIIRMKDVGHFTNHPNSFTMERDNPFTLKFAQAIKESGANVVVCPTGGFHVPELNEEFIASGKADMVGMSTPFIADGEYVKKLFEGRAEDVVPCIRCHDCHGISSTKGPWYDSCNVNPKWALPIYKKVFIPAPAVKKKVAVIGGGPAGMKAAITAAERGHQVTLYEKSDALGGLIRHTDFTRWKWAQKDFKDYLIRQTYKAGVEVLLDTEVTPEMVHARGYDTALVAVGAAPFVPRIPGADGENVWNVVNVHSNKQSLGKNVVLIGAGTFGTETAICLAKDGFKVTILTSKKDNGTGKELIELEAQGPHNKKNQVDIYLSHENISYILEATATGISKGKVTYRDAGGTEKSLPADSVVIYAGLKPRMDEAMAFSGSAGQVLLLGDCTGENGTIQKSIRSAYFMASQV